jgi:hypothetical protein
MCALVSIGLLIAAVLSNPKPDANYVLIASALFALTSALGTVANEIGELVKIKKKEN